MGKFEITNLVILKSYLSHVHHWLGILFFADLDYNKNVLIFQKYMKKLLFFGLISALFLTGCGFKKAEQPVITNYDQCIGAGYKVIESYPRQCQTPDGQQFVQDLNTAEKDQMKTQLPNPASVFCVEQGGTLEMRNEEAGTYGVCKFSDGTECDEWKFYRGECADNKTQTQTGEQESQKLAETWIISQSPTYKFDGHDLLFEQSENLSCPDCYAFAFSFESSHAGFGDRKGSMLAQVITQHIIKVSVEKGRVVAVVTDGKYDEMNQTEISAN